MKRRYSIVFCLCLAVALTVLSAVTAGASTPDGLRARIPLLRLPLLGTAIGDTQRTVPSAAITGGLPSCRSVAFRGTAGVISVQTSPGETIAWGIYMYDPDNRYGAWVVDVMVGTKRDDRKVQDYEPHGSVASESARPGLVFRSRRACPMRTAGSSTSLTAASSRDRRP
jgi:hypothetical protein